LLILIAKSNLTDNYIQQQGVNGNAKKQTNKTTYFPVNDMMSANDNVINENRINNVRFGISFVMK
jgi:hypothetical protein